MWIGAHSDQIWLPGALMSDFEHCFNRLQLDIISLLIDVLYEMGANNEQTWPNFTFGLFVFSQKANYKWRCYQTERSLVLLWVADIWIFEKEFGVQQI